MMKTIRYITLLAIIVAACTNDIEYTGPGTASQLVLNAQAFQGDSLWAQVGHSRFFLDSGFGSTNLSDATVEFCINGHSYDAVYNPDESMYVCRQSVKQGDVVSVSASHPHYGLASAMETIPAGATLNLEKSSIVYGGEGWNYDWEMDTMYVYNKYSWNMSLSVQAPAMNTDIAYYRMRFNPCISCIKGSDTVNYSISLANSMDAGTAFALGLSDNTSVIENLDLALDYDSDYEFYSGATITFTSERLKADTRLDFTFTMPDSGYISLSAYDMDSVLNGCRIEYHCDIILETLAQSTYAYCKSAQAYHDSDWNIFTMEPVTIASNVKGGLGLLSAAATYTLAAAIPHP